MLARYIIDYYAAYGIEFTGSDSDDPLYYASIAYKMASSARRGASGKLADALAAYEAAQIEDTRAKTVLIEMRANLRRLAVDE